MIRELILSFVAIVAIPTFATAAPVTWMVTGTFEDGGSVGGSFVFDAATNTVPTWNVSVSGGNTGVFPALTYSTDAIPVYYNAFGFPEVSLSFPDPNSTR